MAKVPPQVHQHPSPLTRSRLEETRRRLRLGFPRFRDPCPQEVKFKADDKAKWLPSMASTPGLSVAELSSVVCEFDVSRPTAAVRAELASMKGRIEGVTGARFPDPGPVRRP